MRPFARYREDAEEYIRREYLQLSKFLVAALIALSASFLYQNEALRQFLGPYEKTSIEWRNELRTGLTPRGKKEAAPSIEELFAKGALKPAGEELNFFILWFLTACVSLIVITSEYVVSAFRMMLLTALYAAVSIAAFAWGGIVLNFVYPIAIMLACFIILTIYHQIVTAVEERRLIGLVAKDALTELYNYEHLKLLLESEAKETQLRPERPLSIVMMDLDNFKNVNDTFGHAAGDEVIRGVSNLIRSNCRSLDVACRYGGEEFLLMLPGATLEDAGRVAERIRKSLESMKFYLGDHKAPVTVTASFGVAAYFAGESVDNVIRRADKALYKAKEAGRNMVCRV